MITAPNLDRSLIPYMWLELYSLSQVHFSIRIFYEEIQADHALQLLKRITKAKVMNLSGGTMHVSSLSMVLMF